MKISAFDNFVCPVDGQLLQKKNKTLCCMQGHAFDIAREGYCNLLLVQQKASLNPGDSQEMVSARRKFLDGGYFKPIAEKLFEYICVLINKLNHQDVFRIVDAGCGEGYYLHQLSQLATANMRKNKLELVGCDISKWAVKAAAKRSSEIAWVVAGNRQMPFELGSVDLVLSMFGYPDWGSFHKILKRQGRIILIDPGPKHLIELRKIVYSELNENESRSLATAETVGFILESEDPLQFAVKLQPNSSIQDLLTMTPHAFRITQKAREKISALNELSVTVDVMIRILKVHEN